MPRAKGDTIKGPRKTKMADQNVPETTEPTIPTVVTSQPEAPSDEILARDYGPRGLRPSVLTANAKDPNLKCRLERNRPKELREAQQTGYRIAKASELKDDHSGYVTPDGTVEDGDLIVMVAPRDLIEGRKRAQRADADHDHTEKLRQMDEEGGLEDTGPNYQRSASGTKFFSISS